MARKKKVEQIEISEKEIVEKPVKIKKPKKEKIVKSSGNATLIITEKPAAAEKIAAALSNGTDRKYSENGVPFYEFDKNGRRIIVGCAVGHLFGIAEDKKGARAEIPSFEVIWKPSFETKNKNAGFTKKYYLLLKKLSKEADEFIIATDYDIEGEVIGWNVVRFIAGQKDAKRMKFSSLTKDELLRAYENLSPTINWGHAIAGETRHYVDWFYGINLSRALMRALSKAKAFRIMSIGRVQGPALSIVVDKELKITNFKPTPYWQVFLQVQDIHKQRVEVQHIKDLTKQSELLRFNQLKNKKAIAKTEIKEEKIYPLHPFDLTTLQTESYKFFGITPSQTLQIAQKLYLDGLISYPRTSSQKYPEAIGYEKILKMLGKQTQLVKYAVNKKPVEGKKSDPAHPAIYPTGEIKKLDERDKKIYDLILKRFISCFCNPALFENKKIEVSVNGLIFNKKGLQIKEKGWLNVYPSKFKEEKIPTINGEVDIKEIRTEEKQTMPPKRYSASSLLKELEKRNLGTKCLTEDTKIIFDGELISVKELFDMGKKCSIEEKTEIKEIKGNVISLNKNIQPLVEETNFISKRKLEDNEKVIKIDTDSSSVKLTENHLVYCLKNNKITNVPANKLTIDDNLIGILKKNCNGKIVINKNIFNNNFIIKNNQICNKFSSKTSKGINVNNLPVKWSTSLAWILGYYYGDGSYSNPKYNGSHQLYFTTTEKKALELLKQNIKQVFGVEPYCYDLGGKYKVSCNCPIAYAIIKAFPEIEGKKPFNIPKEFIGDFLRGFFDADGNVHLRPLGRTKIRGIECNSFDTPRVKITLARKDLIEWISDLLNKLEIKNHINKGTSLCNGKRFDCWTILISGRDRIERFSYKIGFDSYKEDILYKGLKCNSKNYKILRNCAKIYLLLNKSNIKIEEIIKNVGISRYEALYALKKLFYEKRINKKRFSQANKYIYSLKEFDEKYSNHCMKLIYKKISKDIYEIPIRGISEFNYIGDVFDISISKNSPNFVVGGNILVHNSTRASIIETLYDRGYVKERSIEATPLGIKLIETLKKHSPIIIDENLTRELEKEMDSMQVGLKNLKEKEEKVLDKAKDTIIQITKEMRQKEEIIGKELSEGREEMWAQEKEDSKIGKCPKCKKGDLRIIYNRNFKRYFIGCSSYPECKTTFSLPPNSLIKPIRDKDGKEETCKECNFPMLLAIRKAKRPWKFCFNPECVTNKEWRERAEKKKEEIAKEKEEK